MANNDDLKRLRDEVRKRRAAVTGKERRIFNNTGVDLKGTKEDPRRPLSVVNKYNRVQLKQYLNKLNAFMDRSNGYIADSSGSFIRKADWLAYKRLERKYNKMANSHFDSVKDILDPYRNKTIAETEKLFRPDSKMAQGDVNHRPLSPVERTARNIKNAAALNKLRQQIENKMGKDYLTRQIKKGREQANQMLDNAGLSDLKAHIANLSDKQFDVLWNYWGFGTRLGQIGSSGSHRSKNVREQDSNDRLSSQEKDNIRDDVSDMINEAGRIPAQKGDIKMIQDKKTGTFKKK